MRLQAAAAKESEAVAEGCTSITREQAEAWCALHVGDNWYDLPLMLVAKGYNEDYDNFTEVGADSVYELDESGCYIAIPEWWSEFELWRRDG